MLLQYFLIFKIFAEIFVFLLIHSLTSFLKKYKLIDMRQISTKYRTNYQLNRLSNELDAINRDFYDNLADDEIEIMIEKLNEITNKVVEIVHKNGLNIVYNSTNDIEVKAQKIVDNAEFLIDRLKDLTQSKITNDI